MPFHPVTAALMYRGIYTIPNILAEQHPVEIPEDELEGERARGALGGLRGLQPMWGAGEGVWGARPPRPGGVGRFKASGMRLEGWGGGGGGEEGTRGRESGSGGGGSRPRCRRCDNMTQQGPAVAARGWTPPAWRGHPPGCHNMTVAGGAGGPGGGCHPCHPSRVTAAPRSPGATGLRPGGAAAAALATRVMSGAGLSSLSPEWPFPPQKFAGAVGWALREPPDRSGSGCPRGDPGTGGKGLQHPRPPSLPQHWHRRGN